MAKEFQYKAIDATGRHVTDSISAENALEAKQKLFEAGLVATEIEEKSANQAQGWRRYFEKRLSTRDLILFTQQFRTLFNAGIALPEIFETLQGQVSNRSFALVIEDMHRRIREGESLQQAFSAHKKVFSSLYCAMVVAGENSGALPEVLGRLVYLLEHEEKIRTKIESAVRYPKMVVAVMVGAFLLLLNFVIPTFASLYASARVDLPLPTVIAMKLNVLFMDYWWVILAVTIAIIAFCRSYFKTEQGVYLKDSYSLKLPLVGKVVQKAAIARFASIFSILQSSGISVLDSMDIVADTVNNAFYKKQFDLIKTDLKAGIGIAPAMQKTQGFTPLAVSLVTVGENAGNLEEMLSELAKHYDQEVELAVEELTDWIGPILIICLGVVVLFFALAIFLPMWDMVKFV